MDTSAAPMGFAKRAAIQLLIVGAYVLLTYLAFKFVIAIQPYAERSSREGKMVATVLAAPSGLCGFAYAKSLGGMPSYPLTWATGILFTAGTAVIALLMGIYPSWLTLETDLVPLQQWGILTVALIASISLLAGLFRSGAVFARQGNFSLR